jgi:hypothetical protein
MNTATHYEPADLALFAMQLLEGDEHRRAAAHVNGCAFCRQELARLQGDLAVCAYAIEMHSPGAGVRERILHQVAREKKIAPAEPAERNPRMELVERREPIEEPSLVLRTRGQRATEKERSEREDADEDRPSPRRSSLMQNLMLWLGWTVAAGLTVSGVWLYQQREEYHARLISQAGEVERLKDEGAGSRRLLDTMTDASAQQIVLSATTQGAGDAAPEGHVLYAAEEGALVFLASRLGALEPGRIYELWLIPADGRDPIPAGTFRPDAKGNANVMLPPLPRAVRAKAFGVTVEDGDGSQSPTMPIVLAGS